jgi:hypothetical protein
MAVGDTGASAGTAVENQAAEAIQVLLLPLVASLPPLLALRIVAMLPLCSRRIE